MKTILVPIDFSDQAINAAKMAGEIARRTNAKIVLAHVIEASRNFSLNTMGQLEETKGEEFFFINKLVEIQKEQLNTLSHQSFLGGLTVENVIQMGSPYEGISRVIAEYKADLLVMGTKGSSGMEEVLIGSNTEKVVRYAKCPVITVKEEVGLANIQNIVYATDLKTDQTDFVTSLKKMLAISGAQLYIVKVNTPNHFHTQRQVQGEFKKFIEKYGLQGATTTIYNEATEEDGILYFSEDLGNCMIAIATHGRTGLLHLLSGSIAEDLVNHSTIPVMTLSMKK